MILILECLIFLLKQRIGQGAMTAKDTEIAKTLLSRCESDRYYSIEEE